MNINQVLIVGRLTRDPEMKALPSGTGVTSFSLATSFKNKDKEETEYHNIVIFGKQAENSHKYLKKGQIALVEGRLKTREWEKEGIKMRTTEIIASRVQFGPNADGSAQKKSHDSGGPGDYSQNKRSHSVLPDYPEDEINPEDIPF